jgi:uncharacterized 2Fe-2S/4Fe-4S cluster protein (DUF4445 family)
MSTVNIELFPLGRSLEVAPGTGLQAALYHLGVEFPCGGRGRCRGCRVKVLAGQLPVTDEDARMLGEERVAEGWRLACRHRAEAALQLEVAQWDASILSDDTPFQFVPAEGLGIAIDLGTTTVVGQLLDRQTGHVLGVQTGLNQQSRHGADIMSRIEFALAAENQGVLTTVIRQQLGQMVADLLGECGRSPAEVRLVTIAGNTAMHHLFGGLDVTPLAFDPFEPVNDGWLQLTSAELGWFDGQPVPVHFLPCLGGFVGSDILAGILATGMHEREEISVLVDLGTNGEMVIGNRERMLCASTAAGPAFEGARISSGMRAASGAISGVTVVDGQFQCQVIGGVSPRGVCGSGLVDAVAAGLDLGRILPSGRLPAGPNLPICSAVSLTQGDIRELQLAKGAIAAGLRLLADAWGTGLDQVARVYLAGAFGNYINRQSARRIGLLPWGAEKVIPAGNTSLLGAKLALFQMAQGEGEYQTLRARVRHVPLNEEARFHEVYAEQMTFPSV